MQRVAWKKYPSDDWEFHLVPSNLEIYGILERLCGEQRYIRTGIQLHTNDGGCVSTIFFVGTLTVNIGECL